MSNSVSASSPKPVSDHSFWAVLGESLLGDDEGNPPKINWMKYGIFFAAAAGVCAAAQYQASLIVATWFFHPFYFLTGAFFIFGFPAWIRLHIWLDKRAERLLEKQREHDLAMNPAYIQYVNAPKAEAEGYVYKSANTVEPDRERAVFNYPHAERMKSWEVVGELAKFIYQTQELLRTTRDPAMAAKLEEAKEAKAMWEMGQEIRQELEGFPEEKLTEMQKAKLRYAESLEATSLMAMRDVVLRHPNGMNVPKRPKA